MPSKYKNLIFKDSQGIHIIEKFFTSFEDSYIIPIKKLILDNFSILSNHTCSLSIVKKLIENCLTNVDQVDSIISCISENFITLIQNPSGNYAVQHALDVRIFLDNF